MLAATCGGCQTTREGASGRNGKKKVEYGKRWLVEIAPSAFKRMFGERLYSLKWKNMVQEVRIKVAAYNRLVDMGAGVV